MRSSLVAQWVKNLPANAGDMGLILGRGTKFLCAATTDAQVL